MNAPDQAGPTTPLDPNPAPQPSRAARTGRAAAWVAAGAIGATALTGVAFAASGSSDETTKNPSAGAQQHRPGGPGGPGGHGPGAFGPGGGEVLRGEYVIKGKDDAAATTRLVQSGTVTAVSSSTLNVKSTDGFVITWTIDEDTKVGSFGRGPGHSGQQADAKKITDVKVGDNVSVGGAKTTSTSGTAEQVRLQPSAAERAEHENRQNRPSDTKPSGPRGDRSNI